MNISVVISYCSLDRRFIETTIKQCLIFSNDIIVACFDKLLNGTAEDLAPLDVIRSIDPEKIKIVVLPFISNQGPRYHHNLARWQSQKFAQHNKILFLDADEIPEGTQAKEILHHPDMPEFSAMSFSCYWYFRSAKYRATTTESSPMLIDRTKFVRDYYFTEGERWGFTYNNPTYVPSVTGPNGAFFHHFSWARTKQEMLVKTQSWGHRHDRDWASLIQQEFEHEFNGVDFVHGYSFVSVEDQFNLGI